MISRHTKRRLYRAVSLTVCFSLVFQSSPAMAAPQYLRRWQAERTNTAPAAAVPAKDVAAASVALVQPERAPRPPARDRISYEVSTPSAMAEVRPATVADALQPVPVVHRQPAAEVSAGTPALGRPSAGDEAAVVAQAPATSIALEVGWNLASVPVLPTDTDPAVVLAPIAGKYDLVYAYDNCDSEDPWKLYDPDAPAPASDLTAIDHLFGFWINMTEAATLDVWGDWPVGPTIPLCTDWNLIGYPLDTGYTVPDALDHISGKYTRLFAYETTDVDDPWEVYDIDVPAYVNDLQEMTPGRGFWIKAIEDVTLLVEAPPPPTVTPEPTDTPEPGPTPTPSGPPPEVALLDLPEGTTITQPTVITGTITSPTLAEWKLEYRMQNDPTYVEIGSGTTEVVDGELGTFDPTLLLNGIYELRLTAVDESGQTTEATTNAIVEGNMKVGLFTMSFSDLSIPVSGFPIEIVRTYDSRDKRRGDFGVGWTLDIKSARVQENGAVGLHWKVVRYEDFTRSRWCIEPTKQHVVTVTFSDGRVFKFEPVLEPACDQVMIPDFVSVDFRPLSGLTGTAGAELQVVGISDVQVVREGFAAELLYFDTQRPVDFDRYAMEMLDGTGLVVDQVEGLQTVMDLNGNELHVTRDGIVHSSGKAVEFKRDAQNRITQITDPMGNHLSYSYDSRGDLVQVTDQEGYTTRFTYNADHGLRDVVDPRGVRAARSEFDHTGRLIALVGPYGQRTQVAHDLTARREVLRDPLGYVAMLDYDQHGNVESATDALGQTVRYRYDSRGNLLAFTNAMSETISFSYDSLDNLRSAIDSTGRATEYTYDNRSRLATTTDALGRRIELQYDAVGNLVGAIDAMGNRTAYEHDSQGNVRTITDALGNQTRFIHNAAGNVTTSINASGDVERFTYDANGNELSYIRRKTDQSGTKELEVHKQYNSRNQVVRVTDPGGIETATDYDATGLRSARVLPNGNRTEYVRDAAGRETRVVYPDGTSSVMQYDLIGNLITDTDRDGRTTHYDYDALHRVSQVRLPDGATIAYAYDPIGRVTRKVDEDGYVTTYEHGNALLQSGATSTSGPEVREIQDETGNTWHFTYDAVGNQTSYTDPSGATTLYEYDANDRPTVRTRPDGGTIRLEYDAVGRVSRAIDESGAAMRYAYDEIGRLSTVTDPQGNSTAFTYDEYGDRVRTTDALGRTTSWEYDDLGRMTRRVLPLGMSETYVYDKNNNVVAHRDFAGVPTTYEYDVNDRVVTVRSPDGAATSFGYTPSGLRTHMTDALGDTRYEYDSRGRVTRITSANGATIDYAYDGRGNLVWRSVDGRATGYEYDNRSRLVSVSDPSGNVTRYTYDVSGRQTLIHRPNGTSSRLQFDDSDRVVRIDHDGGDEDDAASYVYDYDARGMVVHVTESTGRKIAYGYDALLRLVHEEVRDSIGAVDSTAYSYDAVGNRVLRIDGSGATTYTYDRNDRLVQAGTKLFSYDANGNLVAIGDGDTGIALDYDAAGRLTRMTRAGTSAEYQYDGDGTRMRAVVNGATHEYIVDKSGAYSRVLAVRTPDDGGQIEYVYGLGLVSATSGSATYYYLEDAQGSVRGVTDAVGAEVATVSYDAYGHPTGGSGAAAFPGDRLRYWGEEYDAESEFYYLRARYYDPDTGRFLAMDRWPALDQDSRTVNRYVFPYSNAVNFRDPTGMFTLMEVMVVGLISGVLAAIAIPAIGRMWSAQGAEQARACVELVPQPHVAWFLKTRLNPRGSYWLLKKGTYWVGEYQVANPDFNCIAWTIGVTDRWITGGNEPPQYSAWVLGPGKQAGTVIKPNGKVDGRLHPPFASIDDYGNQNGVYESPEDFDAMYAKKGLKPMLASGQKPGDHAEVVLYGRSVNDIQHGAKIKQCIAQKEWVWTSKLGMNYLVSHQIGDVAPLYGGVRRAYW